MVDVRWRVIRLRWFSQVPQDAMVAGLIVELSLVCEMLVFAHFKICMDFSLQRQFLIGVPPVQGVYRSGDADIS